MLIAPNTKRSHGADHHLATRREAGSVVRLVCDECGNTKEIHGAENLFPGAHLAMCFGGCNGKITKHSPPNTELRRGGDKKRA